jgi:hydrogenase maturation protease
MTDSLVVLGLGNVLMGDDGLGVRAIEMLAQRWRPGAATRVLDGGTLGLMLLPEVEAAHTLLVVDAVRTGGEPGSLARLEGAQVPASLDTRLSPHEMGLVDILVGATLTGRKPVRTLLLGIVPVAIEYGVRLSAKVKEALPRLVDCIAEEAAVLGYPFTRVAP